MEFAKIVKIARETLGVSQEELAKRLDVSFATINRWENNKTVPNKLTQKVFFEFCEDNHIYKFEESMVNLQNVILTKEMDI